MKWLIADTSAAVCTVVLAEDQQVVAAEQLRAGRTHMKQFFPALDRVFKQAGWSPDAIQAYACVVGPGSFTGLRIAVSALKTQAWARGCPIYGIETLAAWAQTGWLQRAACGLPQPGQLWIAPAMDARNRRVFAGLYHAPHAVCHPVEQPVREGFGETQQALSLADWIAQLVGAGTAADAKAKGLNLLLQGSAYDQCTAEEQAALESVFAQVAHHRLDEPTPQALVVLAQEAVHSQSGDPFGLNPIYLVPCQAERLNPAAARVGETHHDEAIQVMLDG